MLDCSSNVSLTKLSNTLKNKEGCFFNNTRFTTLDDFEKAGDAISSYSCMIIFLIFFNFFWFGFFLATTPFPMMSNSSMLFTFLLSLDWRLVVWWRCGGHFFLLPPWFYYACLAAHDFFFNSFLDLSFVGDNNFVNIVWGRRCLTPPSSSSRFLFLLLLVCAACGVEVALSLLLSFM